MSDNWGDGYEAGQAGMRQALATANDLGALRERDRIIDLLIKQNIIRRCAATNNLVAFNTDGTKVVYIKNLEIDKDS